MFFLVVVGLGWVRILVWLRVGVNEIVHDYGDSSGGGFEVTAVSFDSEDFVSQVVGFVKAGALDVEFVVIKADVFFQPAFLQ